MEAEFSSAKEEEDEVRFQDIAKFLAKTAKICAFFEHSGTFHSLDDQVRLAMLGKTLDDHLKSLSAKQRTMVELGITLC